MKTKTAIRLAATHLENHIDHVFEVFNIAKPTPATVSSLAKMISKFSPLVGNLIEASIVDLLNEEKKFQKLGQWIRQDPDFPDALFVGNIDPPPGFEIKAWFPLATEITARFRESQNRLLSDQTYVALLAWLPEKVLYGRPTLIDVCIMPALSVAKARDNHYHNPPDYLVIEPEDTRTRTRNLQQTNTYGYKWQGTPRQFKYAQKIVDGWGKRGKHYNPHHLYQRKLRSLMGKYVYRLDTNYAKMDRIQHTQIEEFKARVLEKEIAGMSVSAWSKLLNDENSKSIRSALKNNLT